MRPAFRKHHRPTVSIDATIILGLVLAVASIGTVAIGKTIFDSLRTSAELLESGGR